ncbi:MAG TPA: response regulator [Elusimicrobiota bacterium]|nr:response regulator [Elusimicrobiota bacterium]
MASILLVDDDPNIIESLKDILEDAGYDVRTASSGGEARALLSAASADLVIADYNLPDIKGRELADELARPPSHPALLLMTGMAAGDLPPGAPAGATFEILTKPVDPATLLSVLQKALAQRRGS